VGSCSACAREPGWGTSSSTCRWSCRIWPGPR
jgi:hypothetical protein